jgi:hypothetical protein
VVIVLFVVKEMLWSMEYSMCVSFSSAVAMSAALSLSSGRVSLSSLELNSGIVGKVVVLMGVVVGVVVVGVAIVVVVGSLLGGVDEVVGAVGLDGLMTEAVASMGDGFAAIFACIVADIVLNTSFKAFLVDRAVDQNCGVQTREKTRMQTAIIFKGPINGPSKSGDVVGVFFFFRPIFLVD